MYRDPLPAAEEEYLRGARARRDKIRRLRDIASVISLREAAWTVGEYALVLKLFSDQDTNTLSDREIDALELLVRRVTL